MGDLTAFDLKNRPEGWGIDFGHRNTTVLYWSNPLFIYMGMAGGGGI